MKNSLAIILAAACLSIGSSQCNAQGFFQDYFRSAGTAYQPSDPWIKGSIYRTHIGHDGLYYNCDKEECKRNSPYILWKTRPCQENIHTLRFTKKEYRQSLNDAICRWKRGSCQACPTVTNYPPGAGYGELKASQDSPAAAPGTTEPSPSVIESQQPLIIEEVTPADPKPVQKNTNPKQNVGPNNKTTFLQNPTGLIPQSRILGRKPSAQDRVIGQWNPVASKPEVQRTAAKPSKKSFGSYGAIYRASGEKSQTVIR